MWGRRNTRAWARSRQSCLQGMFCLVGCKGEHHYYISCFPGGKLLEWSQASVSKPLDLIPHYICVMPDKACSLYLIWSWKQSSEGGRAGIIFSILQLKTLVNWLAGSHSTPDMTGMRPESRSLHNLFMVLLTAHWRLVRIFPAPPSPHIHQLSSSGELTTTELVFILLTHLCPKEKIQPWLASSLKRGNIKNKNIISYCLPAPKQY